jgi:hypothetical protein
MYNLQPAEKLLGLKGLRLKDLAPNSRQTKWGLEGGGGASRTTSHERRANRTKSHAMCVGVTCCGDVLCCAKTTNKGLFRKPGWENKIVTQRCLLRPPPSQWRDVPKAVPVRHAKGETYLRVVPPWVRTSHGLRNHRITRLRAKSFLASKHNNIV